MTCPRSCVVPFLGLLAAIPAFAVPPIAAIRARYSDLPAVHVTLTRVADPEDTPGAPAIDRHELVVDATGAFRLHSCTGAAASRNSARAAPPFHFVYFHGWDRELVSARPPGGIYLLSKPASNWFPVQHIMAPWALLEGWAAELERGSVVPALDRGNWTACLERGALTLCIRWRAEDGVLLGSELRYPGGASHSYEYEDFAEGSALPRIVTERVDRPDRDGRSRRTVVNRYEGDVRVIDAQHAADELRFDQASMNVNYYHAETGNVISPAGQVLYNERDLLAALDRGARVRGRARTAWVSALIVLVLLSSYIGWKRLRAN